MRPVTRSRWFILLRDKGSYLIALLLLGLVAYAVFFPRAERGPKEIAQEIQPSKEARDSTQGTPRLELDLWVKAHEALVKEVAAAKQQGVDLVFYGDSITESWRGTQLRVAADKFAGIPAIYAKHYGQLKAAAYGIAGDTTVNLLWRLQNGEGPEGLSAKAIVVLIGTNDLVHQMDLTAADAVAANVSTGAVAVVDALRQQAPRAQVLLLAVLPRGDRFVEAPSLRFLQPSKFTAAIDAINERMKAYAVLHKQVEFVECGEAFLEASEQAKEHTGLDKALIPDTLHPSPEGMEKLAQCLQPHLRKAGISAAAAHRHLLAASGA